MLEQFKSIVRVSAAAVAGMALTYLANYVEITVEQTEAITQLAVTIALYAFGRFAESAFPDSSIATHLLIAKKPGDIK